MRKIFKKTAALLLAVVMLCGMVPAVSHAVSEYTISVADSVDGTATVKAGETVNLRVIVEGASFNGMEAVLSFDEDLLRLESAEGVAVQSDDQNGEVKLYTLSHEPYASGACIAELIFTALGDKEKVTASVELSEATVGDYDAFESGDAIPAAAYGDTITIKPHNVIKPDLFWGNVGVKHGSTYMFGANDGDYSYGLPSATMDGEPVEVIEQSNNRWRINNVIGDIMISDPRIGQEYSITFTADEGIENLPENGTVINGEDFTFTVPALHGYIVGVEVMIGGVEFEVEVVDCQVTIPGEAIVGDITVHFTKTADNNCGENEHVFGEPTYRWSSDYATCNASRVCSCGEMKEEETAISRADVHDDKTTYTAEFRNPAFETQVITVDNSEGGSESEETISVRFRLIGDSRHDDGAEGHEKYVTWIPTKSYKVEKGSTVFDVLTMALDENGMNYETSNKFVTAIQAPEVLGGFWLANGDNGPIAGWMYTVGGTHPQVTMSEYELENRDVIIVHYCDDFTLEESPGAPYYQRWLEAPDVAPSADNAEGGASEEEEEEEGSVILTPQANIRGNKATATVESSDVDGAIEAAKKDDNVSNITIAPVVDKAVDSVTVEIPKASVGEVAKSELGIIVETDIADVRLPVKTLEDVAAKRGQKVAVSAEKTKDGAVTVGISLDGNALDNLRGGIIVSLPSEDSSKVLVRVDEDGNETVVKKSAGYNGEVSALLEGSATVKLVEGKNTFDDIGNHWGKNAIEFAANRELFNGVADNIFAPNGTMTRAMLVTVLHRLENEPTDETYTHKFEDVEEDQWYSEAIAWANALGIVEGHSETCFDPNGEVTREQIAVILHRYAEYLEMATHHKGDMTQFGDHHETSEWAVEANKWAVGAGIIEGKEGKRLDPTGNATRAEVATVLERLIKLMLQ